MKGFVAAVRLALAAKIHILFARISFAWLMQLGFFFLRSDFESDFLLRRTAVAGAEAKWAD